MQKLKWGRINVLYRVNSTSTGKICFSLYNKPIALEIFKDTCATCLSYFNDEAKITLRKFD